MRELKLDISEEPVPLDVFSTLQLRTLNEPLLPDLKTFEVKEVTADVIPFLPLFLSHRTTQIDIQFADDPPAVMVASMIINLPKLCPYMQHISLQPLSHNATMTSATSEMLLTCNLDTLRYFLVDSALTKEANQFVCQLHNLRGLWLVFPKHTSLPALSLPNLTELDVEYHDYDWLRVFNEAKLSKLREIVFHAKCDQIGNFLEAFEIGFASSASTLSEFRFYTSRSWNPSYHSLLSFRQLQELVIEFPCLDGCSSSVDDEIVTTLARAMPKLETLQLGKAPCQAPSNVTVQGLIALAHHCPCLLKLCIHFQTDSLAGALTGEVTPVPSPGKSRLLRDDCTLATLEVGRIPLPQQSRLPVVFTLLRIFPHLLLIEYVNEEWKWVADTIKLSQKIDSLVHHSGKMPSPALMSHSDAPIVSRFDTGNRPDDGQG